MRRGSSSASSCRLPMRLVGASSKLEKCSAVGCCRGTVTHQYLVFPLCSSFITTESHLAAGCRRAPKERARQSPRRSSGASHRHVAVPGETCDPTALPDFAARGAFRPGCARNRRGAGRQRSQDPFLDSSIPCSKVRGSLLPCPQSIVC